MKPIVSNPFAIPFGLSRVSAPEGLNMALRALFLEREAEGATYANRRATMQLDQGLFESRFDLFRWPEPCVRELREFCWQQLYHFVADLGGMDEQLVARLRGHADAWFHITRRGGHFGLHNHPMASWSGVYCVDPGASTSKSGGLLSFPDPNGAAAMFKDPANQNLRLPYSQQTREYFLEPGQLLIFPSWLPHQVTPFAGEGVRITVAFNAWFQLDARPAS